MKGTSKPRLRRWNRIYSESDDVNKVQRNIRIGHQKTVDEVLAGSRTATNSAIASFCDAVAVMSILVCCWILSITPAAAEEM